MRARAPGVLVLLFLAGSALAQGTRIEFSASVDGGFSFQSGYVTTVPGADVWVQALVTKPASATGQTGLAGFNFKPRVTTLGGAPGLPTPSSIGAWTTPQGSVGQGGPGVVGALATGRVAPFGAAGVTNLPLVVPITGGVEFQGAAVSNAIPIAQLSQSLAVNSFGNYFNPGNAVVVFRFQYHCPGEGGIDQVGLPLANLTVQPRWYDTGLSTSTAYPTTSADIFPVTIDSYTPAPGTAWVLGLGGLLAARRRR